MGKEGIIALAVIVAAVAGIIALAYHHPFIAFAVVVAIVAALLALGKLINDNLNIG